MFVCLYTRFEIRHILRSVKMLMCQKYIHYSNKRTKITEQFYVSLNFCRHVWIKEFILWICFTRHYVRCLTRYLREESRLRFNRFAIFLLFFLLLIWYCLNMYGRSATLSHSFVHFVAFLDPPFFFVPSLLFSVLMHAFSSCLS